MLENSTILKRHIGKFLYTLHVGKCWKIPQRVKEDIGEFLCIYWKGLENYVAPETQGIYFLAATFNWTLF